MGIQISMRWKGLMAVALCGMGLLASAPAMAQDASADSATPTAAAKATRALDKVLITITQTSGIAVVADSSVGRSMVVPPADDVTAENLETQIAALVKTLPRGTTWAKLYLPDRARPYRGDDVADYALAQAKLFGSVGASNATTVEIMGQKLANEKATPVVSTLNLKPIYLITNPTARQIGTGNDAAGTMPWSKLTAQQQQELAQQQAQKLLSADPQTRAQMMQDMMGQQAMVMRSLMQNMTQEQRQQFFQGMGQMMGGQGGFGGRGGRRGGFANPPGPGGN